MRNVYVDFKDTLGEIKAVNGVGNGPLTGRFCRDRRKEFRAAGIPYSRLHDTEGNMGSGEFVNIHCIFKNFDADEDDPGSYSFAATDIYIQAILDAGTKVFYRLGETIENKEKILRSHTYAPKDPYKWARICEHIIRHYNEGWADGFRMGIEYWEIWNEPDCPDDAPYRSKLCWGGTRAQFFDFYETAAKHLKTCFPQLKIGGPALAWDEAWAADFLQEMHKRNVPLDFFSWHCYGNEPVHMMQKAERIHKLMVESGYGSAESILNEWNYVRSWVGEGFMYSVKSIIGIKGAAYSMACMSAAQKAPIDMLMYYDARPTVWNGLFDFYTYEPLKGYYPFKWYSEFYGLQEVRCNDEKDIYALCGRAADGKTKTVVTYYVERDDAQAKEIELDFGRKGRYEVYALNAEKTNECIGVTDELTFTLEPNSCLFIKEI